MSIHAIEKSCWSVPIREHCQLLEVLKRQLLIDYIFSYGTGNCAMSRCFPFPPPGYETKRILEDLDLLKEAKRKDKKQKKEKKDKERKKDKEKKEKDGSDENHREKKDRKGKDKDKKEKRKDKKDKEDRSKDKDKSSISEESTISGKLEEKNGDRLYPKGHNIARTTVGVDEGKQQPSVFHGRNWEKSSSQSSLLPSSHGIEESKFVKELDRRIRDDKDRGSQLPESIAATMERRDKDAAASAPPVRGSSSEKVDNKSKLVDEKMEVLKLRTESDKRSTMVQSLVSVGECKVEETPRPLDRQNDRRVETKQKHEDKLKDRDKKSHGKDKLKEKEAKKEGKSMVKSENRKSEKGVLKEVGRNNVVGIISGNNKSTDELKDIKCSSSAEGNIRKRKHMETNGFLHGTEISPNKMPRPAASAGSLNELKENGSKHDITSRTQSSISSFPSTSSMGGVDSNKEWLVNGKSESHIPSSSKPCNPSPSSTSDQVPKTHLRESGSLNGTPKRLPPKINHQITETASVMLPRPKMNDQIAEKSVRILPPKMNEQITERSGPPLPMLPPPKMKDQSAEKSVPKLPLRKMKDQIAEKSVATLPPPKMKDEITETSSSRNRPPHPDSKYLLEILSVPNPLDWSAENIDDQEWLFSNKKGGLHSDKRAKLATSSLEEEPPHVWSEAVYIQSADVYALPYVIPY